MNRDDFFKGIERKIATVDEKEEKEQERREKRTAQVQAILRQADSILVEYASRLQEMGVTVDFKRDELLLSFILCYKDGHRFGFSLGKESRTVMGTVYDTYPTKIIPESKKDFGQERGLSAPPLNEDWSKGAFEAFVQAVVEEFFGQANNHGGYKGAPNSGWNS